MHDSGRLITRILFLNASTLEVWDALTNPEKTRRYMFNCEVFSSWEPGEAITWKGVFQGYETVERGVILESEKGIKLAYSWFSPNFGLNDVEENYLHISYALTSKEGGAEVVTTVENFNSDPGRMVRIARVWDNVVLPAFKELF